MKNIFLKSVITFLLIGGFDSCTDMGTAPKPPSHDPPILSHVFPDSGFAGDTVTIIGKNFGSSQGSSTVKFGSVVVTEILSWQDTVIIVKIPNGASGIISLTVTVGGSVSNGATFNGLSAPTLTVSFANDVEPLFVSYGCTSCHGGTNNLFVDSYAHLMAGNSLHGPVVTPGDGEGSVIIEKLRGTASFGVRMPQGGPYLPDSLIAKISTWITEGAHDN